MPVQFVSKSIISFAHHALNREQEQQGVCPRCKQPFVNLINETEVRMDAYSNQLDSILAGAISFTVCRKQSKTHHFPHPFLQCTH